LNYPEVQLPQVNCDLKILPFTFVLVRDDLNFIIIFRGASNTVIIVAVSEERVDNLLLVPAVVLYWPLFY